MEKDELITYNDPKSPISEVFRTLRTNLQFMTSNKGLKTILVTSCNPGEGKSWVSANLISAFAQEGKKVLLIDSDMRKGRVHNIFKVEKRPGLSNFLSGIIEADDKDNIMNYIKQTKVENLYVMPSGDIPPNPSELLISAKTEELIEKTREIFDIIVFDGTPSLVVTDALILARQVDTTVIVTSYKMSKMGDVEKIKKSIENVGGRIAGIVINKIQVTSKKYENSYYYGHRNEKSEEVNSNNTDDVKQEKTEEVKEETTDKKDDVQTKKEVHEEIQKEIEKFKENTVDKNEENKGE